MECEQLTILAKKIIIHQYTQMYNAHNCDQLCFDLIRFYRYFCTLPLFVMPNTTLMHGGGVDNDALGR
jgi:hypothetical protein